MEKTTETVNPVFDIESYIPVGHENAVSRQMLEKMTGVNDSIIRRAIAESTQPIINSGNGEGYYVPDMNDPVDVANLRAYVLQEQARVRSLQDKIALKFQECVPDLFPETEIQEPEIEM